ncbi:hypothetical protein QQP08_016027 [Theobroma cacao]|uniref:Uncharacterized protein n=1 Tax=Theobroma cacao TaxID=3641 RepID=A0A061EWP8_THECC|nr:Uncharacterized protein TCM_024470 [Theobroma cacao]WRX23540.1 hypothetical protein QQP08_016027 [Theobroma cacao]
MAGLQYNFFPTDFYYPRPQSVPADAGRVAAVTIQTQKKEVGDDLEWPRSLGFRVQQGNKIQGSKAGVSMRIQDQNEGTAYIQDQGKLVTNLPKQHSWFILIPEEL